MRSSFASIERLRRFRPALASIRFVRRIWGRYVAFHTLAAYKVQMAAFLGIIGFPLFFVLYTWISPQAYESPSLRACGFLVSLALGFSDHWPPAWRRYLPAYSYISFIFALPFFFVFMLLMNDASTVWQVSTMAAFVYMALLYDSVNMIVVAVVGSVLGWLTFHFTTGGAPIPPDALQLIPIVAFALTGLVALNYSDSRIADEKMQAASRLASHIAHEMRTPLLGIKFDAERANKHIPKLTEALEWALQNGYEGSRLSSRQAGGLRSSMERIRDHTQSANLVIDMLLVNAGQENLSAGIFDKHSVHGVITDTLHRYHFRPGESERVVFDSEDDFEFFGSDLLLVHTLFNLLKNGLRALEASGGGQITIRLEKGAATNKVIVADNGPGIPPDILPHIFVPFFTGVKQGQGTGIGLAFSKFVVESFDGTLSCRSAPGKGAEFTITLPSVPADTSVDDLSNRMQRS